MNIDLVGGTITINGVSFSGRNVRIDNDKIIVDGKVQSSSLVGPITVTVNGNCGDVQNGSGDIIVNGTAQQVSTGSGKITCGDVHGNAQSGSGNINCQNVSGNVKTGSGNISRR